MKITAFNGSPRAERSNTHVMVEAFLAGAREAGAEVESVQLAKKQVRACTGCVSCWFQTPGKCAQRDDMDELFAKVTATDILVFASPLYWDNVTGLMKNFMDRLVPLGDPHFERDENGEARHLRRHPKPHKIAVISNNGFPQQTHFQVLRVLFKRIARNMNADVVAEIYRDNGGLLTKPPDELRPAVDAYLAIVKRAGKEVVERDALSADTKALLEQPLFSSADMVGDFIATMNPQFDKMLTQPR